MFYLLFFSLHFSLSFPSLPSSLLLIFSARAVWTVCALSRRLLRVQQHADVFLLPWCVLVLPASCSILLVFPVTHGVGQWPSPPLSTLPANVLWAVLPSARPSRVPVSFTDLASLLFPLRCPLLTQSDSHSQPSLTHPDSFMRLTRAPRVHSLSALSVGGD